MQIINADNATIILPAIIGLFGIIMIICIPFFFQNKKTKELAKEAKPILSEKTLEWEINGDEQKENSRKAIIRSFYYSVPIYLISSVSVWLKNGKTGVGMLMIFGVLFVIGFGIAYWRNLHSTPKDRKYRITDQGIEVSLSDKKDYFEWKGFEFFYSNPDDATDKWNNKRDEYVADMKNIRGEKFYIQLKAGEDFSISKNVLVIYSEPDNYKKVYEFIKSIIPEKSVSISGFTNYLYK